MPTPPEVWKTVPNFTYYIVSSLGRFCHSNGRPLNPHRRPDGYLYVALSHLGWRTTRLAHRLVAEAFLGPSDLPVNHKNFDRMDNRAVNLEYLSIGDNVRHAAKHGRLARKLVKEQVLEMEELYRTGAWTKRALALKFGVTDGMIGHILQGHAWKHTLQGPPETSRYIRGEVCKHAKLTEAQVREIRLRYAEGTISQAELARTYGVGQMTISWIVRGVTWKHVQGLSSRTP